MPALRLFNRRTIIGGDELQPVSFATISLRLVQLVLLLLPITWHLVRQKRESLTALSWMDYLLYDPSSDSACRHSHYHILLLFCYIVASILYTVASIYLEYRIGYWSSQGRPTEIEPRSSNVGTLLEFKLVPGTICMFLIWLAGICALCFAPVYYNCLEYERNGEDDDLFAPIAFFSAQRRAEVVGMVYETFAHHRVWWLAYAALLLLQILEVVFAWMYLFLLCRFSTDSILGESMDLVTPSFDHQHELMEQMWADRCAFSCRFLSVASCFMFGGRELLGEAEYGHVARALADYLETRGVLDVVPSDIITGLLLLQRIQKQRVYKARHAVLSGIVRTNSIERGDNVDEKHLVRANSGRSSSEDLLIPLENERSTLQETMESQGYQSVYRVGSDGKYERHARNVLVPHNFDDMRAIEEGARYSKFALAIYTWIFYLYDHPITGLPRLLSHSRCHCCRPRREQVTANLIDEDGIVEGDNACEFNRSALLLTLGLDKTSLVYASIRNGLDQTPYAILLDHAWKSVVITIRGTFSLEDCVTDVLLEPESLEQLGQDFGFNATNQYCHGGVLGCVRNIHRDLQKHGHLDRLLKGQNALYPDYTLILTGHSLGAATCTILSYMLRNDYPTLRCINFSPPGCSMTWESATDCHSWCTSYVLDSDLVSRLTLESMEKLRDEILILIGRVKVPKIEVASKLLKSAGMNACKLCLGLDVSEQETLVQSLEDILYKEDEVPSSDYVNQLERLKGIQHERRNLRGVTRTTRLFPPGRLIHLVKTGEKKTLVQGIAKCLTCCTTNLGSEYVPMWINNDDLNEIVVSSTMGTDHFTDRMCHMLESVARDFGLYNGGGNSSNQS